MPYKINDNRTIPTHSTVTSLCAAITQQQQGLNKYVRKMEIRLIGASWGF